MSGEPTAEELLNADIDTRLLDLWVLLWELDDSCEEATAAALRMAYGSGYRDALMDHPHGKLYLDHGCQPPIPK